MQVRLLTTAIAAASAFAAFAAHDAQAYDYTAPVQFHTVASFDPTRSIVPFPTNLLLSGTTDLTLNIPVDPTAPDAGPKMAMNALDGFSTTTPWSTSFSAPIDATSLVPGNTVRMFQVELTGVGGGVKRIIRELASPQEFVVALAPSDTTGSTIAIVPTQPLQQLTSYMAVLTTGIKNAGGQNVRQSLIYRLAQRTDVLCSNNQSTVPALPAASACALEPLRQLINSQEAAATTAGVAPGSIALSWTATTQSITPTFLALESVIQQSPAAKTRIAPTGKTLGDLGLGLPPVADIYIGTIDLPYYLTAPTAVTDAPDCTVTPEGPTPCPPLISHWQAAPGAYVPPFDKAGLDPTSTNLTFANPLPVATSTQTVPMLLTLPNAKSGKTKPAAGWPLVIFQHGITRNRTDMFAVAGTLAAQGFAVVAIDLPLHGVTDKTNPFYVGNTPFAALGAHERTFDIDLQNNSTGAPGPDGVIDSSGSYFINLTSLLTSRDNLRQGVADMLTLSHAVSDMHVSTGGTDFDTAKVNVVSQSLGSIVSTMFMAIDPNVNNAVLSVPGGGIVRLLDGSPTFGPRIRAGLAAAGLQPGTPAYDAFFAAAQTSIDSGDPINYAGNGTRLLTRLNDDGTVAQYGKNLLLHEVIGGGDVLPDQVIPNRVPGAPLSGTEPLIAALGLAPITKTVLLTHDGLQGVVRFTQGEHGSLLDPTDYPLATKEMQGEMASFLSFNGLGVLVNDPSVIQGQQ
jgi:pimeloyl-ACP methyl ester carboxylesterase